VQRDEGRIVFAELLQCVLHAESAGATIVHQNEKGVGRGDTERYRKRERESKRERERDSMTETE